MSSHAEYGRFRSLMTDDVNAAIRGAFDGGADSVVVSDGHGGATNILIDELDPRATLNCGNASAFAMVQGIGENVDGALFVGYHARAGTPDAILDHTWSGSVYNVWLNGTLVGEIGLNAAVCGHFGAPVLMVSGCRAACAEASQLLGNIETAPVKEGSGRASAECKAPEATHALIADASRQAVARLADGVAPEAWQVGEPVGLVVEFGSSSQAGGAARLPGAQRDGRRISSTQENIVEAYRAFGVMASLA